jgi:hypothetical protein
MLRDDELRQDIGRCDGGSFCRLVHVPTGITRVSGPLRGAKLHETIKAWRKEIEGELIERGLVQYVLPTPESRDRR